MTKYRKSIINRAKSIIDGSSKSELINKYYNDYYNKEIKVLIRDDAKDFCNDWVEPMVEFINKIGIVVDVRGDLDIRCRPDDLYYTFYFGYHAVIPIELLDSIDTPTNMYQPKEFVYETNIEKLNETFMLYDNDALKYRINREDVKPELKIWVGDVVKIKPNALDYYENKEWCYENEIGQSELTANFMKYCIKNDVSIKAVGKFKGTAGSDFPWWTIFKTNDAVPDYVEDVYVPDTLIQYEKIPTYSPKKFIYESIINIKYFNPIKKEKTNSPYRFKTREEFEKEYGENWRQIVPAKWTDSMDGLLGEDFKSFDGDNYEIKKMGEWPDDHFLGAHDHGIIVSRAMLISNNPAKPMYAPKKFIYEESIPLTYYNEIEKKSTRFEYRFKTEEEFEEEYSENWADDIELSWMPGDMDYLFGINIQEPIDHKSQVLFGIDGWNISNDMITKNKLMNPTYEPRKLVYEDINIEDLKHDTPIKETITEFTNDYDMEVEDNIDDFLQYYNDLFEKVNPRLQQIFKENIKKEPYNTLIIKKHDYNLQDKIELMILLDSIGVSGLNVIKLWKSPEHNQSFIICFDKIAEKELDSLDQYQVYKGSTTFSQKMTNHYPKAKVTQPMSPKEATDFINKIVKNPGVMYKPKQFVYENLQQYHDNINELDIDTLIVDKSDYDEALREELISLLEKIGVDCDTIRRWHLSLEDSCFVITLNNADDSKLGKNFVHQSSLSYIYSGFSTGYPLSKPTKEMGLQKTIDFIKSKIIPRNASSMYQPKKFIYESKITNEHIENYLKNSKELDFNTIIFKAENIDPLKLDELKQILEDLKFGYVNSSFNNISEEYGKQALLIIFHDVGSLGNREHDAEAGRVYTSGLDYIEESLSDHYPFMKWNDFMKIDDIIKLFEKLTGKNLPNYKPKKFVYESNKHYPYRFKTREEFDKEFKEDWETNDNVNWSESGMKFLIGTIFPFDEFNQGSYNFNDGSSWYIERNMLTENKPKEPSYKPKKMVYEASIYYPYRFKTGEEMEEDFGPSWQDEAFEEIGWNPDMDHFLGEPYPYHEEEIKSGGSQPRKDRLSDGTGQAWAISWDMLRKNERTLPSYEPRKLVYEGYSEKYDTVIIEFTNTDFFENYFQFLSKNGLLDSKYNRIRFNTIMNSLKEYIEDGDTPYVRYVFRDKNLKIGKMREIGGYIKDNILHGRIKFDKIYKEQEWNTVKSIILNDGFTPDYKPKKFVYESNEPYPYRFKTEREFIEEYGENWHTGNRFAWADQNEMDYLFGTVLEYEFHENEEYIRIPRQNGIGDWVIRRNMLTENKPKSPTYEPKKLVYESKDWTPYRFKTRKEFEKEYGEQWKHIIADEDDGHRLSWVNNMDYLFGTNFDHEFTDEDYISIQQKGHFVDTWKITRPMITKNKPNIPDYTPKKFVYENIKKLNDFE